MRRRPFQRHADPSLHADRDDGERAGVRDSCGQGGGRRVRGRDGPPRRLGRVLRGRRRLGLQVRTKPLFFIEPRVVSYLQFAGRSIRLS